MCLCMLGGQDEWFDLFETSVKLPQPNPLPQPIHPLWTHLQAHF